MTFVLERPRLRGTDPGNSTRPAPEPLASQVPAASSTPSPDAPVVVGGVCQSFGGRQVLRGVDLVVERGSFHGVIGPNGAGKTTLVEIIQGARRPDGGRVELLGGQPWPRDPALLARVGIQSQATAFFSRATVAEHLSTVASIFGASQARAQELVEVMGLGRVRGSRVERLSGGERQKLAVASAMVHRPEVLFLDEPTAALDATARHDLVVLLAGVRDEGTTVVYTTHYLEEAERLCDVVSILDGGQVVRTASPSALLAEAGGGARLLLPGAVSALDAVQALVGGGVVEGAQVSADGLVVHVRDVGDAFAALEAVGVPTRGAQVHGPTLEDAFVQITGKSCLDVKESK